MHEALLWKPLKDQKVHCELCNHYCTIKPGARGKCGVRENHGGTLHTLVYDRVAAANVDPIEKKPLYHFLPGTTSFSIGTMGCNMECSFCQNFSLSQPPREGKAIQGHPLSPEDIVRQALDHGCASISYTYSEPTIFFELMLDTARLATDRGLKNVIVSNGYMTDGCLEMLGDVIHAANIDLKAFTDSFYQEICGVRLKPVLHNLAAIKKLGWWLEVTTLLIPGLNDSEEELTNIVRFIRDELGADTPWHVSRFHPTYQMLDRPSTPVSSLERALNIGRGEGLNHVYVGNVPGHNGEDTLCPECGCVCLDRSGFRISSVHLKGGKCGQCGIDIAGVFQALAGST